MSSPRELTPVLVNTLRRWKSTVRGLTNSCAATSLFDIPFLTSWATCRSCGVNTTSVAASSRRRTVSPEARSSVAARSDHGRALSSSNRSSAARSWMRASTRRLERRKYSP